MTKSPNWDQAALRDRLLLATLPHVVFDGWRLRALTAGAQDIGLDGQLVEEVFPGGLRDLAVHFNDWSDRAMLRPGMDLAALPVRQRVARLVRCRLEAVAPHREAARKAIAYLTMPGNATTAAKITYRTVDAIWYAAGDTATDMNYYTKRGLLAAVYTATVLYWLADESEEFADSWAFLDRRIAEVMAIPRLQGRFREMAERLPSPLRLMRPFFPR